MSASYFSQNSLMFMKFLSVVLMMSYLFLIIYVFNNVNDLNYVNVFKSFYCNQSFSFLWINFFLFYNYVYMFVFKGMMQDVNSSFLLLFINKYYYLFLLMVNILCLFDNNYNFKKIPDFFFLMAMVSVMVLLSAPMYKTNLVFLMVSVEILSVSIVGYFITNVWSASMIKTVMSYLWSSMISALVLVLIVFMMHLGFKYFFLNILICSYMSIKLGLFPFGFWLYFFYKNCSNVCLSVYLIFFYPLNIMLIFFLLNCLTEQYMLELHNMIYFKSVIVMFNMVLFNFFYKLSSLRSALLLNTTVTSSMMLILMN